MLGLFQIANTIPGKGIAMLLWFHPIFQSLVALLTLYVLSLGLARAASRHFGKKTTFKWDRHVLLGKVVVFAWILGGLGGMTMSFPSTGTIHPQSLHFQLGVVIIILLLVAYLTGRHMDQHRNQSEMLPVIHLANNILLLVLVAVQIVTGIGIVRAVLLP